MNQRQIDLSGEMEHGDEGFLLLGALVLIFLLLLAMSVAAPRIAKGLQRDKEVESEHRANQYVRAIRMYYKKFGHYPASIDQLEKTNNQRFLRQRYVDPLTGKPDWRLIHLGENQTKVKGFFGQELQGLQSGLGSAAGIASNQSGTAPTASGVPAFGNSGAGSGIGSGAGAGSTTAFGASGPGPAGGGNAANTASGLASGAAPSAGTTASSGSSSTGADAAATGGLIMGIGSSKSGEAMLVVNEQTTYETWEFLYDPRIEQLYAKGNLLGGGITSGPGAGSGLGSLSGSQSSGQGAVPGPGTGQSPGAGGLGAGSGSTPRTTPP